MVARILSSPHFGEHRAPYWLDAVRYADTTAFIATNYREIGPSRLGDLRRSTGNIRSTVRHEDCRRYAATPRWSKRIATGFQRSKRDHPRGRHIEDETRRLRQGSGAERSVPYLWGDYQAGHLPAHEVRPDFAEGLPMRWERFFAILSKRHGGANAPMRRPPGWVVGCRGKRTAGLGDKLQGRWGDRKEMGSGAPMRIGAVLKRWCAPARGRWAQPLDRCVGTTLLREAGDGWRTSAANSVSGRLALGGSRPPCTYKSGGVNVASLKGDRRCRLRSPWDLLPKEENRLRHASQPESQGQERGWMLDTGARN